MRFFFLALFTLIFFGCSLKQLDQKETKIALIKSPKIRYNDIAYLKHNDDTIELQMYNAGVGIGKISIGYMVCIKDGCITKSRFNKEFLEQHYPDDILKHILLAQPIYNAKNLQKTQQGFIQRIKTPFSDIVYRVTQKEIFFKDKKNHIIIKLKDVK